MTSILLPLNRLRLYNTLCGRLSCNVVQLTLCKLYCKLKDGRNGWWRAWSDQETYRRSRSSRAPSLTRQTTRALENKSGRKISWNWKQKQTKKEEEKQANNNKTKGLTITPATPFSPGPPASPCKGHTTQVRSTEINPCKIKHLFKAIQFKGVMWI